MWRHYITFLFFGNKFVIYVEPYFFHGWELFCESGNLGFDATDKICFIELHTSWLFIHMSKALCFCPVCVVSCMLQINGSHSISDAYRTSSELVHPCEVPWPEFHTFRIIVSVEESFNSCAEYTSDFRYAFFHFIYPHRLIADTSCTYPWCIIVEIGSFTTTVFSFALMIFLTNPKTSARVAGIFGLKFQTAVFQSAPSSHEIHAL